MDPVMIDSIIFPFARILPFIAIFFMMRGVEEIMPSRMRRTLFYAGLSFALAGVIYGEIMWYVLRTPFEESKIYLVVIELLNLIGAVFLYVFANLALSAFGKKSYALSDLAHLAFVFTSFLAIFLAIALESEVFLRGLSDLLVSPFSYFLYALSLLLIYEIYEKLSIRLSFLALMGSFLITFSLLFSLLPDFQLFLEGTLSDIDAQPTFFMLDLFQAIGCVISALPVIFLYRSKSAEVNMKEMPGISFTIYLQELVNAFGAGVLELFRESFKDYEKDGMVTLKEDEWRDQIESFIAELYKSYGKAPVEIAKSINDLKPIAEKVEFYYERAR
jgi:hypothetical protein